MQKITPEQAKLPAYGGNRRVAGLRREEVAMLAGVSVDYCTKLEREHLFHLANATATIRLGGHREASQHVRQSVQRVVDSLADAPAFVRNNRRDLLASLAATTAAETRSDAR